jgi:hypothetical protein
MDHKAASAALLAVALILMGYLGLGDWFVGSDASGFYLQSKMLLHGCSPYDDSYFALMPFMVYPVALSFAVFGEHVWAGNLVEFAFSAATMFLVLAIGERLRKYSGAVACIMLLFFSLSFHSYSRILYGIYPSCAFVLASIYSHMLGRRGLTGFLAASSVLVRLNNAPLFLIMSALNVRCRRYWAAAAATAPIWAYFILKPHFIDDVVFTHLQSPRMPLSGILGGVGVYLESNWVLTLTGLAGLALAAYPVFRPGGMGRVRGWLSGGEHELTVASAAAAYLVLPLFSPKVWGYYLVLATPYLAILSALTLLRAAPPRRQGATVLAVLLLGAAWSSGALYSIYLGPRASQQSGAFKSVLAAVDAMPGSTMVGLPAPDMFDVGLRSSKMPACRLLSALNNYYEAYHHRGELAALAGGEVAGADVVLVDLNVLESYRRGGVSLGGLVAGLGGEGFVPDSFVSDRGEYHTVIWGRRNVSGEAFPKPSGRSARRLFERFFSVVDGSPLIEDRVSIEAVDSAATYIPGALLGENGFNETYVAGDPVYWPAAVGSRAVISGGGLQTQSYLASEEGGMLEFIFLTFRGDELVSAGRVLYDGSANSTAAFELYGKSVYPGRDMLIPTYTQIRVGEAAAGRLGVAVDRRKAGALADEEYFSQVDRILGGAG